MSKNIVMVGAGPCALTAAIYTTREDLETTLYEKSVIGGLAAITDKIDNYPGFAEGIEGMRLASQLQHQAERFGANIELGDVTALRREDDSIILTVDDKPVEAAAVLIATGSDYKKTGVPNEAEFYGRGVHYCATCDGAFYRDKKLVVIGGGNSAIQEAIFLTRFATHIDLLVRSTVKASEVLQRDLEQYVADGKITVHLGATPDEFLATDNAISGVAYTQAGEKKIANADGIFTFIGLKPNTGFLENSGIELDEQGLIKTNQKLETTVPGVFAAGDVRSGATMQIASAVGEGATAALSIREYLEAKS
jgi:thioredoxin reductase (NADPH)